MMKKLILIVFLCLVLVVGIVAGAAMIFSYDHSEEQAPVEENTDEYFESPSTEEEDIIDVTVVEPTTVPVTTETPTEQPVVSVQPTEQPEQSTPIIEQAPNINESVATEDEDV